MKILFPPTGSACLVRPAFRLFALPCLLTGLSLSVLPLPITAQHRPQQSSPQQEIRAFWADGFSEGFKTPQEIDTLLARLRASNCNAIFAQVRKGGDAYYLSRYEPWASDNPQHFDALASLIEKAHKGTPRIQVHAWINTCAVGKTHGNPFHIAAAHPEYLSLSDTGENYDQEATKIDPGNPDAADWTFRVYLDVARHYDVDGIHFDFVRYGSTDGKGRFGYNPVSVARFNARYGRTGQPNWEDPLWKQWRRDQVTALVRKVYAMATALKPHLTVSAATITWGDGPHAAKGMSARQFWNEKSAPMNRTFQDWRAWMEEGILDLNCQMSYYQEAKHPDWYRHWIDWGKDNQYQRWVVPSSGIWLNPIADSFKQIDAIRGPSKKGNRPHGVLLYSYSGTNAGPGGKEQTYNEAFYQALSQPSSYAAVPPFEHPAEFPVLPWKDKPKTALLKGFILTADALSPVDGAKVTVSGKVKRTQFTDGTGFYAFMDLPPGTYHMTVQAKGYTSEKTKNALEIGKTDTLTVQGNSGPLLRTFFQRYTDHNVLLGNRSVAVPRDEMSTAPAGSPVMVTASVVAGTDIFLNEMYIADSSFEEDGSGILRVHLNQRPVLPFQTGDRVLLKGIIYTIDGEKVIDNASARLVAMSRESLETRVPWTSQRLLAGKGVTMTQSSMLQLSGQVTDVKSDRFVLNDGTPVEVLLTARKDPGVESVETALQAPEAGRHVIVTGIVTVTKSPDGKTRIRIRPRSQQDIEVLPITSTDKLKRGTIWLMPPFAAGLVWLAWRSQQSKIQNRKSKIP